MCDQHWTFALQSMLVAAYLRALYTCSSFFGRDHRPRGHLINQAFTTTFLQTAPFEGIHSFKRLRLKVFTHKLCEYAWPSRVGSPPTQVGPAACRVQPTALLVQTGSSRDGAHIQPRCVNLHQGKLCEQTRNKLCPSRMMKSPECLYHRYRAVRAVKRL